MEETCKLLLLELQKLWSELGEDEVAKDEALMEIERQCLEVYKRKVDEAIKSRSEFQHAISAAESEMESICSALGEQKAKWDRRGNGSLKDEIEAIVPKLEEMRRRREKRKERFLDVVEKLETVSNEIFGSTEDYMYTMVIDATDLTMKKLEELQNQLRELQDEKSKRLKEVMSHKETLKSLCEVLGMDFKRTAYEVLPSLGGSEGVKDLTNDTIKRLITAVQSLREVKLERMKRLQDLASVLLELWDFMDTPFEEQQMFHNVTRKIVALESDFTEPNMLSLGLIKQVEDEVSRLEQLKSGKVKEIVLKKMVELEEICRSTHLVPDARIVGRCTSESILSGAVNPVSVLEEIEVEISKVKVETSSRKEILDKVEKWLVACEDESWLEEYNRDNNRYNAGRGAHLTLKRAEKARVVVNKIPAIVEALISKTMSWEEERGIQFLYDGGRLLSRLEAYSNPRQEKEQERQRQREQKKLQGQQIAEQEVHFGSKPSPSKSVMKPSRPSTIGVACNRKLSLGGAMLQSFRAEKAFPKVHPNKKGENLNQNSSLRYQKNGGFTSQSSVVGGRYSEVGGGHLVKKHSASAVKPRENESRMIRKPLSPVSLAMSSKANIANFLEDQKRTQGGSFQATLPLIKELTGTPPKFIPSRDEENRTPKKLATSVSTTPSTISAPMLMAITPATPYVPSATVKKLVDRDQYSFGEMRAGFVSPIQHHIPD